MSRNRRTVVSVLLTAIVCLAAAPLMAGDTPGPRPIEIPASVLISQAPVQSGGTCVVTVLLNDVAAAPVPVAILASNPSLIAQMPSLVVVPAGAAGVQFTLQTAIVSSSSTCVLTAVANGYAAQGLINVAP